MYERHQNWPHTLFDDFSSTPLAVLDGSTSGGRGSGVCNVGRITEKRGVYLGSDLVRFGILPKAGNADSLCIPVYISLNKSCNKHLPRSTVGETKDQLLRFFEINRDCHSNFTDPRTHHQLGYQIVRKQPKTRQVRSLMKCKILLKATTFHLGFNMASSPDPYKIWAGRGLERIGLRRDNFIFRRLIEVWAFWKGRFWWLFYFKHQITPRKV